MTKGKILEEKKDKIKVTVLQFLTYFLCKKVEARRDLYENHKW